MRGKHENLIVADMSTINPTESKKIAQKILGRVNSKIGHSCNGRT